MAIKVVTVFSGQTMPSAECFGVDESNPCGAGAEWPANNQTRDLAKKHAEENPGHRVRVTMESVHVYVGQER